VSVIYSVLIIGCFVAPLPNSCFGEEVGKATSLFQCNAVGVAGITAWMERHPGAAFIQIDCIKQDKQP
jgi:hypothetical protein